MTNRNSFPVKHGHASRGKKTRTYKIWAGMCARCNVPSATGYERYGGLGVQVCERWIDYMAFLTDMGEAPEGMSIDRLDGTGNYEPGNCQWATRQTQNENRRSVIWIEAGGLRLTATAWAKRLGICKASMYERLERWTLLQAVGIDPPPPRKKRVLTEAMRLNLRNAAFAREAKHRAARVSS